MRTCAVLCCLLMLAGCGSKRAARSTPAGSETTTRIETAENVSVHPGQIQLASGRVLGAPPPTTQIGVSKPYMLKPPT